MVDTSTGKILIFGVLGQVGGALCARLGARAVGLTPADADFLNPQSLSRVLDEHKPSAVINAAAYTAVDQAESDRDRAFLLNAESPGVLARWCATHETPFIHYSTDYVYPGQCDHVMTEQEPCGPLNVYGESKLAGDRAVAAAGGRYLIFRTSWVYDATGNNFFRTMLRLGQDREKLRVVADQTGSPTFAGHIADLTIETMDRFLIPGRAASGVYHLCNSGFTSWRAFAEVIFQQAREAGIPLKVRSVEPLTTDEYPTPARRPLNSRLSLEKFQATFGLIPPTWQQGLEACMRDYGLNTTRSSS